MLHAQQIDKYFPCKLMKIKRVEGELQGSSDGEKHVSKGMPVAGLVITFINTIVFKACFFQVAKNG